MVYRHLPYIRKLRVHGGPVLGPIHPRAKKYPKIHLILDFSPKKNLFTAYSQENKIFLKMVKNAIFGLF